MCNPLLVVAAAQTAASIGSSVAGYQAASAQAKMQNQMYAQNKANSYAAMRQGYTSAQRRQQQEIDAAANDIQEKRLEAIRQMSTANVAAGEAGVTGFSVERVLRESQALASRDISNIQQNRDWSLSQLNDEMLGISSQTKSRILSVPRAMKPSVLPFIIQAGSGTAKAFGSYAAAKGGN